MNKQTTMLLHRARHGSRHALDEIFRQVAPRMLKIIRLRLGPELRARIESQDVLQTTLLKAFQHLEQFNGSGSKSLMGWLVAIASNEMRDQLDYYGRKRRDAGLNVPLDEAYARLVARVRGEVSRLYLAEQELRLERALEALRAEYREVIVLRKFEDLSFKEIGERMERTPDACRMLLARAMTALCRNLAPGERADL